MKKKILKIPLAQKSVDAKTANITACDKSRQCLK
jgi:hypothetical protein